MEEHAVPLRGNRDFLLLWTGQAASVLGTRTASVAYPLLALALTHSAVQAGLVAFFGRLPWFAFTLVAGAIADRVDRKKVMLASDAVAAAAMMSVTAALAAGALTLFGLFVAAFAEGTAFVFMHVCQPGALRRIVPAEQVPDAIVGAEAREYGTALAGPPLGGVLYGLARSLPFGVNAVSYLFSSASVLLIRTRLVENTPGPREPVLREIGEGIRWLWGQPFLRASLLLVGLVNFFSAGVLFVLVVVVRQHGGSAGVIGAMLAVSAVGGLLGALVAPKLRRLFPRRVVVLSIVWVGAAVSAALATVAPHALALGAIVALFAFFGPTWNAVVDGYRVSIVPGRLQGRVSSVDALLAFSAIPLGPLVGGVLISAIGGRATLVVFGGLMLAAAVTATVSRTLRIPGQGAVAA